MPRRKTDSEYRQQLKDLFHGAIYYDGKYITGHRRLTFHCTKSPKHVWRAQPYRILKRSCPCPFCSRILGTRKRSAEETKSDVQFRKDIDNAWHGRIVPISKYHGYHHKVEFKCTVCGHIWWTYPTNIEDKLQGCKVCSIHNGDYATSKILPEHLVEQQIRRIWHNKIHMIRGYHGVNQPAVFECAHHHFWRTTPDSVKRGHGCPHCQHYLGESAVASYLIHHNYHQVYNARSVKKHPQTFSHVYHVSYMHHNLRFDFILNVHGKLYVIEFDGVQHFKIVDFSGKLNHLIKAHASTEAINIQKRMLQEKLLRQLKHDFLKERWSCEHLNHKVIRIENTHDFTCRSKVNHLVKRSLAGLC